MKRALAASALTVLAVTLAACGTGGGGASATTADQLPPGQQVSGEITFWHSYSAGGTEVKQLEKTVIPAFEKAHPGTKVKAVTVQYDQMHQKLVTAAAGSSLPDVIRSDIIWVPELAKLGVLVPLSDAMPDFKDLADKTFDGPLATNLYKGKYYGLPLDTNTKVMLYNQQALQGAGLTAPKTFDDLKADGPKLAAQGKYLLAEGDTGGWNVLPYIWSNGGEMTDKDVTKATGYLNGPKSVEAIQMLADLYKQKAIPKLILGGGGGTPTAEGLAKGTYATIVDGPWTYPPIQKQFPNFKLEAAPLPSGSAGSINVVGGEDIVITSASKNKALAAEFTRFMLGEEAQTMMAQTGQLSVLKSLSSKMVEIEPYYAPFLTALETARPRPPTPAWAKIDDILRKQVQLAIRGDVPVQKALDDAVQQIDPLLARG
ncbi:extracellular solute-binding protein [Kribbella sp. NPDC050470]|uniref:extracellular solute-binding protein n=1 Tax=unclassified Kribbella TaxID=2644121 RepID=UPI0037AE0C3C